ncbi:MAG: anhydro-N-acetylmuramic acid kinase, partial [Bacteroidia bacterium]
LHTCCEHIADQISSVINKNIKSGNGLVTGGGAFNSFLVSKLNSKTELKIVIPDPEVINYKEALIFAFLGLLRMEKKINVLSAVTGASEDSCSGVMVLRNDLRKS